MQKSIEAQQQQIQQRWVEQVKSRDSQIQDQQQMNQVRSSASRAPQALQSTQEEQNITAIRSDLKPYDGSREKVNRGRIQWGWQVFLGRPPIPGRGWVEERTGWMQCLSSFRYYVP
jgi:hypothetical protein